MVYGPKFVLVSVKRCNENFKISIFTNPIIWIKKGEAMLILQTILATIFLAFGSSLVLAESSVTVPNAPLGPEAVSTLSDNGERSESKEGKLEILESKLDELENRIDKFFPNSSPEQQGLGIGDNPYDSVTVRSMQEWSYKDHLVEARTNQQMADTLEKKLHKLQSRIDRFSQKPYLDTKGFKRSGLETLKGQLTQELREATQKTAWHKSQAKTIMISESKLQQNS